MQIIFPYSARMQEIRTRKTQNTITFYARMHSRAPERLFNSTPLAPLFSNFVPASDKSKETMMCAIPFLKPNSIETTLVPL